MRTILTALCVSSIFLYSGASSAAELNPNMRARIAAIVSEGEGTVVTEELMRKGNKPGTEIQKKLTQAANAAAPFLNESVRWADWNDSHMGIDGPSCFDAGPKLGLMFRALGLPGWVAAAGHHVFMIVETKDATLLIDPTIRQYFGQDSAPSWVPRVFVGTLSELKALYAREPGLPNLPYNEIYFNPEWPAKRKDSKMLSARGKFLRSINSKEHAPLTEYFNKNAGR